MRLICTITADETALNPYEFSYFLTGQGISNELEMVPSIHVSRPTCRIWVHDEDHVEKANALFEEYRKNPKDPRYHAHYENAVRLEEERQVQKSSVSNEEKEEETEKRTRFFSPSPYGPVSIFILIVVISLFIWAQMQRGQLVPPKITGIVQAPLLAPVERVLLFDYPLYFQIRDKLFSIYTVEEIKQKQPPPPEAQALIQNLRKMPVWMGIYDPVVSYFKNGDSTIQYQGPLFEKIRSGEVWRLFTPALMHFDLLHIFFNVLWFILLGNQIEHRIGFFKYLLLILVTAIFSNTAQYLMSGPFFMGLSGIVVGMAAFIFARQQVAPWEGYLLHRFTLIFLAIFVIGMFFLQLVFFILQIFGKFELTIGIANTAHLVGGIMGYLLGRMRLFSLRHR